MKRIFLTCGEKGKQFDRLLKEMDKLKSEKKIIADIYCQSGASTYKPNNFFSIKSLTFDEFDRKIAEADIVVGAPTHQVTNLCFHHDKPFIAVPRLKRFGESNKDSELEFARSLESKGKALKAEDVTELEQKINDSNNFIPWIKSERARMIIRLTLFIKGEKVKV